jgi:hypothetical protein
VVTICFSIGSVFFDGRRVSNEHDRRAAAVRPGDLATEFKERTNKQLSEKLPEDMAFLVARLRSLSETR